MEGVHLSFLIIFWAVPHHDYVLSAYKTQSSLRYHGSSLLQKTSSPYNWRISQPRVSSQPRILPSDSPRPPNSSPSRLTSMVPSFLARQHRMNLHPARSSPLSSNSIMWV